MTDELLTSNTARTTASLLAGALGGALLASRWERRQSTWFARALGAALVAAAAVPAMGTELRTAGARRRRLGMRSTVEIDRPVADVFAFFKDFENFPRVIGALGSVTDFEDGRSRWVVFTASGATITWDAQVTKYVPNHVIAWESVPGSVVESSGLVRFEAMTPTRTRVELELTYRPRRTDLREAVWALVSAPASHELRSALEHARFYIESLPPRTVDEPREARVVDVA